MCLWFKSRILLITYMLSVVLVLSNCCQIVMKIFLCPAKALCLCVWCHIYVYLILWVFKNRTVVPLLCCNCPLLTENLSIYYVQNKYVLSWRILSLCFPKLPIRQLQCVSRNEWNLLFCICWHLPVYSLFQFGEKQCMYKDIEIYIN